MAVPLYHRKRLFERYNILIHNKTIALCDVEVPVFFHHRSTIDNIQLAFYVLLGKIRFGEAQTEKPYVAQSLKQYLRLFLAQFDLPLRFWCQTDVALRHELSRRHIFQQALTIKRRTPTLDGLCDDLKVLFDKYHLFTYRKRLWKVPPCLQRRVCFDSHQASTVCIIGNTLPNPPVCLRTDGGHDIVLPRIIAEAHQLLPAVPSLGPWVQSISNLGVIPLIIVKEATANYQIEERVRRRQMNNRPTKRKREPTQDQSPQQTDDKSTPATDRPTHSWLQWETDRSPEHHLDQYRKQKKQPHPLFSVPLIEDELFSHLNPDLVTEFPLLE